MVPAPASSGDKKRRGSSPGAEPAGVAKMASAFTDSVCARGPPSGSYLIGSREIPWRSASIKWSGNYGAPVGVPSRRCSSRHPRPNAETRSASVKRRRKRSVKPALCRRSASPTPCRSVNNMESGAGCLKPSAAASSPSEVSPSQISGSRGPAIRRSSRRRVTPVSSRRVISGIANLRLVPHASRASATVMPSG